MPAIDESIRLTAGFSLSARRRPFHLVLSNTRRALENGMLP